MPHPTMRGGKHTHVETAQTPGEVAAEIEGLEKAELRATR